MAMELDNSFSVPVPPEQAWDVLLDVKRIAPCMPGATVDEVEGDVINGHIKVKVGPVSLTYRGTATFTERDADARVVVLEASGKETRGAGTASATVRASLEPDASGNRTLVTMHTTMNVTGRPAQFGRGVMVEVGGKLVDQFAANLATLLGEEGPDSTAAADGGVAAGAAAGTSADGAPERRRVRHRHGRAAGRSGPGRGGYGHRRSAGSPGSRGEAGLHQPGQAGRARHPQARRPRRRHRRGPRPPGQAPVAPRPPRHGCGRGLADVEFQEVVRRRHMVRRFSDEPVSPESLDRILANAVRGPSAGFSQGQAFLVLTGEDLKRFWPVAGAAASPSVTAAPLVIVPMSAKQVYLDRYAQPDKGWTDRDETRWPVPFWHIDTGMAALLILMTVVDEGLAALYFGIVPEDVARFREAFGVPDDLEPIGAIAIGHNAEAAPRDLRARRRPAQDVIHYGRW